MMELEIGDLCVCLCCLLVVRMFDFVWFVVLDVSME